MQSIKERKSCFNTAVSADSTLTNKEVVEYNKREQVVKCSCGRVVAVRKDNKIYVKCKNCMKWVAVFDIMEVQ